jgi:hypothetical protein
MIHLIKSTSYKRFTNIKEEIERLSVHQFEGQSVKDQSGVFLGKAKELENHGFYEHRLTLVMLDSFLELIFTLLNTVTYSSNQDKSSTAH